MGIGTIFAGLQAAPTIMSLFGGRRTEGNPYASSLEGIQGQQADIGNIFGRQGRQGFDMANQFQPEYAGAQQDLFNRYKNLADNGFTSQQKAMLLGNDLGPGYGTNGTASLNNTLAQLSQAGLAGPDAGGGPNSSVAGAITNANLGQQQNLMAGQARLGQQEFQLPFQALEGASAAAAAPYQMGQQQGFQGYGQQMGALGSQVNTIQQLMGAGQQQRQNQIQDDSIMSGAAGAAQGVLGQIFGRKGGAGGAFPSARTPPFYPVGNDTTDNGGSYNTNDGQPPRTWIDPQTGQLRSNTSQQKDPLSWATMIGSQGQPY